MSLQDPSPVLFEAIRIYEGDDGSVGPAGERGAFRITPGYWQDACQFAGVSWDYTRMVYSPRHCRQVMLWYWQRYGARTDEQRARSHNGGPHGHYKAATEEYGQRVLAIKKSLEE